MSVDLDDPFADVSPWDEPSNHTAITEEKPMTTAPQTTSVAAGPAPYKIGLTVKAGADFGAEWMTPAVYGHTAAEAATRGVELLTAMKESGLIDLHSKFAQYTRDQYKGAPAAAPKRFENGKVVAASPSGDASGYTCDHGTRTFKDGGSWAAQFCGGRGLDKSQQCPPLWRQKDGTFRAN